MYESEKIPKYPVNSLIPDSKVFPSGKAMFWQLRLIPKTRSFNAWLSSVTLTGSLWGINQRLRSIVQIHKAQDN